MNIPADFSAQDLFEKVFNCECEAKYTDLECLLTDKPKGTYKDIDIQMMWFKFFTDWSCFYEGVRYYWGPDGKMDHARIMKNNLKRTFTG